MIDADEAWRRDLAAISAGLDALAEKARGARDNPPARPDTSDGWRPSGLLIALGDLVDDMSPDEMRADLERAEQERGT